MGKRKTSSHSGPHKSHGPKRKMFHEWDKVARIDLAKAGLLSKYCNRDSFILSCNSRGIKNIPDWLWYEMISLPTDKEKKEWFKNLKTRNISKEDRDREEASKAKAKREAEARELKKGLATTNVKAA